MISLSELEVQELVMEAPPEAPQEVLRVVAAQDLLESM
jgi:hypothetical protein